MIKIFNGKSGMHVRNCEKNCEWNFSNLEISIFLNLRKIHTAESFIILRVSSCVCNKKDFYKKNMGSPAQFLRQMDIDDKKWVKFVAMQQDCAILIYDLNTMKGTVESYNKTMAQQFKTVQLQA